MKSDRYKRALKRNLHEAGAAILERKVLEKLHSVGSYHGWDFFRVANNALFNSMMAHAIKVFEQGLRAVSFWYLYKHKEAVIDSFSQQHSYDLASLKSLSDKLKKVRNKTHFHIDKDGVLDPHQIWRDANISGKELGEGLQTVWAILDHLYQREFGEEFDMPNYDGGDVIPLIHLAQREGFVS